HRMEETIRAAGRIPLQRTTLYGTPPDVQQRRSYQAPPLGEKVHSPALKHARIGGRRAMRDMIAEASNYESAEIEKARGFRMALNLTGRYELGAPVQEVWDTVLDPDVLRECIPGCSDLEAESDTDYRATVTVKVGPIKATFKGRVELSEMAEPNSL